GAFTPRRTWFPFTPSTVTVTSLPMTTVSPTRRVKISIAKLLLGLCRRSLGRTLLCDAVSRHQQPPVSPRQRIAPDGSTPRSPSNMPWLGRPYVMFCSVQFLAGPPVRGALFWLDRAPDDPILIHFPAL